MLTDCLIRIEQFVLKQKVDFLREKLKNNPDNSIVDQLLKIEQDINNIKNKYNE